VTLLQVLSPTNQVLTQPEQRAAYKARTSGPAAAGQLCQVPDLSVMEFITYVHVHRAFDQIEIVT
jgi:hypothetical protein